MYWITIVYNNGRRESHNNLSKEELNRYFNSTAFDETVSHVNYGES